MSLTVSQLGGLIALGVILLFSFGIAYDVITKSMTNLPKDGHSSNKTPLDIFSMTYIDIFLIFTHMIFIAIAFIFSFDDLHCNIFVKGGTFLFYMSRCIMYLIFVRRIQIIYGDTICQLSKLHIHILYILITLYFLAYISYINWALINSKYDEKYGCLIQYKSSIIFLVSSGLHFFIVLYYLYLFIFPLYRLIKEEEEKNKHFIDINKLYIIIIKYTILYSSSIFSSLLLILLSYKLPFGYNYSIIDSFINGMILILLHPIHNKILHSLYSLICCVSKDLTIIHPATSTHSRSVPNSPNFIQLPSPNTNKNIAFGFPKTEHVDSSNLSNVDVEKSKLQLTSITISKTPETENNDIIDESASNSNASIKDMLKQRAQNRFHSKTKDEVINASVLTVNIASGKTLPSDPIPCSDVDIQRKKIKTLQLINWESTHL